MEKMSAEKLVRLLKNRGLVLTKEEADGLLEFFNRLLKLADKVEEQSILQKSVLNFSELCRYLQVSPSYLYRLTSQKQIPCYCPQGKKLYFRKEEIDQWLLQNRQSSSDEIEKAASNYILTNRRGK